MRLLLLLVTLQTLLATNYKPTGQPSRQPTGQPSRQPTGQPSRQPTRQPTVRPSRKPSAQPTRVPTGQPSRFPSGQPSAQPSMNPTRQPTRRPSRQPSSVPTGQPSRQPFGRPTGNPTRIPTGQPSRLPSSKPTGQPSRFPSGQPTTQPTGQPSLEPSTQPTSRPTRLAEGAPGGFTTYPTGQPSGQPTSEPSTQPTGKPSLTVCAAGHYGNGVTPCTACPSGRYKSSAGGRIDTPGTLADCSFCPAGSTTSLAISPNFGSYLSTAGSSVSACNLCLPGYYRSPSSCVSCPANTYKSQPGNWASCPLCPAGKVANSTTFCLNVVPTRGDYKPSTAVRAGSNFPHLKYGAFFEASSDSSHASFNISSDSTLFHASIWSVPEYIAWSWSFSPFCLLMFMAGWTCVLLFQVFYALRKKVPLLRCEPHPDDVEDEPGLVIKHRRRLHVAFVVVCATTLSAAHIVMLGFVYMETAANTASAAISGLLGAASTIQSSSSVIQSSAAALSARVSAGAGGACYSPDASSLLAGYSAQLTQEAARLSRLATSSGAYVTLAQTNVLGFYMNTYRIYLIIVFFILAVLLVGGFLLALYLQHVKMLHCLLGATEFVMLGLSLVAAVEVLVVMALGDFCLDPWKYINVPPVVSGETAQGVLSYYLHCTAPQASPFQSSVNAVNSAVYASSDSLGSIALNSAACVSEAVQVQALLQTALASTKAIEAATAGCAPVYGQIKSLVEDAVCGIGYTGLLVTFISHVATNGLLLFLLVSASLVFSYRGLAWRMSHKSVHDAAVLEKALRESGRKVLVEIVPTLGGRSFASSRVGVNPTLAELDPNPFRDPLGPSLFSDDEGVGSVDLGAQTEWESARPSQRITIRGSSRRLPQTTAAEEKEWA